MGDQTSTTQKNLGVCLVTGAAGFLGRNLVKYLLEQGLSVKALVRNTPLNFSHPALEIVKGDITDSRSLIDACFGVNTVFHTASVMAFLGGNAVTQQYRDWGYNANVGGTKNVISGCHQNGVSRLIYTSSVDVCFDRNRPGQLNRQTPYTEKPSCIYSETKQIAEKLVIAANGKNALYTCAIRPDGIYGAEENYMIDTFAEQLLSGRLVAKIGGDDIIKDNSHVLNLVVAHHLAASQLGIDSPVNGNAYFIVDNEPMNAFEFFRPLIEGLGYKVPKLSIPSAVIYPILQLWQYLHFKIGFPEPALAPHELDKVSFTHFGSNIDAEKDFGYRPVITVKEAMAACLIYCRDKFQVNVNEKNT
jgi:3beta-hydroxy-delta5-steroid dehydrogenase/steroid delta-isomerase